MNVGQPVADAEGNMGKAIKFGPQAPDITGDRLVTIEWQNGNIGFAWRSEFQATDLRTVDGLVWRLS